SRRQGSILAPQESPSRRVQPRVFDQKHRRTSPFVLPRALSSLARGGSDVKNTLGLTLLLVSLVGCQTDKRHVVQDIPACGGCGEPTARGTIQVAAIHEASGIVASALHEDTYYVHNDSGDRARFFAVSGSGADLGTYNVSGAGAVDWEDVARGPC